MALSYHRPRSKNSWVPWHQISAQRAKRSKGYNVDIEFKAITTCDRLVIWVWWDNMPQFLRKPPNFTLRLIQFHVKPMCHVLLEQYFETGSTKRTLISSQSIFDDLCRIWNLNHAQQFDPFLGSNTQGCAPKHTGMIVAPLVLLRFMMSPQKFCIIDRPWGGISQRRPQKHSSEESLSNASYPNHPALQKKKPQMNLKC